MSAVKHPSTPKRSGYRAAALGFFVPVFIATLALAAGCGPKNLFVLLPDPDGRVGAIEISNPQGTQKLDQAYQVTGLDTPKDAPSPPKVLDRADVERRFKGALEIAPEAPPTFLLYFETGAAALNKDSADLLPKIIVAVKQRSSTEISVVGHADAVGSEEVNRKISMDRANAVAETLARLGIDRGRILVSYHGKGNPLVPTADGVAEPRNRRVEVTVR